MPLKTSLLFEDHNMADFETTIKDAVTKQEIPGCALVSTNGDGRIVSPLSEYFRS